MENQDTHDIYFIEQEDQNIFEEERDISHLETPQQPPMTEQQRILFEQRQLSSIASFGQIMQRTNLMSTNQQDFFSDKNDSLQSFKYKSNAMVEKPIEQEIKPAQEEKVDPITKLVPGSKSQRTTRVNSQGFNDVAMAVIAKANGLQSTLKPEKYNSQRSDAINHDLDKQPPAYFSASVNQKIPLGVSVPQKGNLAQGYNPDSPSRQKANYLGEKIRQSHQQQQNTPQIAQDVQEKLQTIKQNFKIVGGGHHQNSGSVAADFSQLVGNSFDRVKIQFQINQDQKLRAKSSTRVNHLDMSNNNSNNDSASNLLSNFYNPSLELLNSPKEKPEKIPMTNNQSAGGAESNFFAPVIQKQHVTYHKNAFTNRGEKSNQLKFQNLMKQQQIQKLNKLQSQPPLKSPTISQQQSNLNLIMSAHSKNSVPQKNTMRSQISQNSGGTATNKGELISPNMSASDVQDPYAYYNIHQNSINMGASQQLGVKSCRPTLYNKQQLIISQRNQQPEAKNQSPNLKVKFEDTQESLLIQDFQNSQKTQSPGASFIQINQNAMEKKIMSGVVGNRTTVNYYENSKAATVVAKTSGKGSSNFNSSATTIPAAPIQKLSDVQNPQKFMTFRFVNRKVTKICEIIHFKNLQELDLSGNLLQEQVKELGYLSFLKRLNLSNNQIQDLWIMPSSIEILNLSYNYIKVMPEEVAKKLKNITTIDISNNKLQTLEKFQYMCRMKRLLAKNNFVRELEPIGDVANLFELDLEGNAIDSHRDFLKFIKNKNDLIVVNLAMNPLMVEVHTIEKFNEDLIGKAPDSITRKTSDEIEELKLLFNCSGANLHTLEEPNGEDSSRMMSFHLIEELQSCITFLKNGVLYRNRRVFSKIKHFQLKTKRSVSDNSNSSQLTSGLKLSPMMSKKSQRYEDIEAAYDCIVEQEELKRLKQKKILAKKRKQRKRQMISQIDDLDGRQLSDESSEGNSSDDFSDDDIDDEDYFEQSQNLNLDVDELRDDLDEQDSCMIDQDQDSSRLYQQQQLHDDEEISQTITSDLDADLNSYKQHRALNLDDHDYLNGSTAGFCKKLREINREINQEQQQQMEIIQKLKEQKKMQLQSAKKEKIDIIDIDGIKNKIKMKQKFDLNLSKINMPPKKKVEPKKKQLQIDNEPMITEMIQKKLIKTVQNSQEGSQTSGHSNLKIDLKKVDQNHQMGVTTIINSKDEIQSKEYNRITKKNLNQSFSLRNMPAGDEVESLMMNKQMQQKGTNCNEQASLYIMIDSKPRLIQESQSQQLKKKDDNSSSFEDSMAQSVTTKKHPNFKLDLSKCKNDDEEFGDDFEEFMNDDGYTVTQDNAIDYITLDKNDQTLDLDQIVLLDPVNENVNPNVEKIFSPKQVISPDKKDLERMQKKNVVKSTVRDPTPALIKTRSDIEFKPVKKSSDNSLVVVKSKKCTSCNELTSAFQKLMQEHHTELTEANHQINQLKEVIDKIKYSLNIQGDYSINFAEVVEDTFNALKSELSKPLTILKHKKQLQLNVEEYPQLSGIKQISQYNTKRSEQEYMLLEQQQFAKIPQPPKTTTSRHIKKKTSLGGNSRVSVMSNETPENAHLNPRLQIHGQHVQFSKDRAPSQLQHTPLTGTVGKKEIQDFIQRPLVTGKDGTSLNIKTAKLQQAQLKLQEYISSERLDNSSQLQIKHNKAGLITDINGIQISAQDHLNYSKKSNTVRNPSKQNIINLKKSHRYEHQYEANTFSNCSMNYPINDSQMQNIEDLNHFLENTKLSIENSQNSQNKQQRKKLSNNKSNKSKSQRVIRKKPLKQDEGIIIQNMQLIQQQILRNQSNTSRGGGTVNGVIYHGLPNNSYQSQSSEIHKSPEPDAIIPIVKSKNGKMNNTITIQQKQKKQMLQDQYEFITQQK